MNQNDTNMRALVPYVAPKKHFLVFLYNYFKKIFAGFHTFFCSRWKTYSLFISLFSFGIILGAYYSHLHCFSTSLVDLLSYSLPLIIFAFLCGMTLFGLVAVPICSVTLAFLCGMISQNAFTFDAIHFLRYSLFCILLFSCNLFFSEAILIAAKACKGYKEAFFSKSFVIFFIEFLITLLFHFLLANTL